MTNPPSPGLPALARTAARLAALALALAGPLGSRGDEPQAPVMLPAFNVVESVLSVNVRTEFRQTFFGAFVTRMFVGEVKTPSVAQRAGLKKGMEIVAIQGKPVAGLSESDLSRLLVQPGLEEVVLLVRPSWLKEPREYRLPVGKRQ